MLPFGACSAISGTLDGSTEDFVEMDHLWKINYSNISSFHKKGFTMCVYKFSFAIVRKASTVRYKTIRIFFEPFRDGYFCDIATSVDWSVKLLIYSTVQNRVNSRI